MPYERKTIDEFDLEGCYEGQWEVLTTEATRFLINLQRWSYNQNEPETRLRIKKRRVLKTALDAGQLKEHFKAIEQSKELVRKCREESRQRRINTQQSLLTPAGQPR
jgi:hypothetical protein